MRYARLLAALLLALSGLGAPLSANPVFPERQRRAVVDEAHVLTEAQEAEPSARILRYVETTHHQFVVVTVPTLQRYDVRTCGYELLRHWSPGDRDWKAARPGAAARTPPGDARPRSGGRSFVAPARNIIERPVTSPP